MRRSDISDGMIRVSQAKTGAELSIPLHPALVVAVRGHRPEFRRDLLPIDGIGGQAGEAMVSKHMATKNKTTVAKAKTTKTQATKTAKKSTARKSTAKKRTANTPTAIGGSANAKPC